MLLLSENMLPFARRPNAFGILLAGPPADQRSRTADPTYSLPARRAPQARRPPTRDAPQRSHSATPVCSNSTLDIVPRQRDAGVAIIAHGFSPPSKQIIDFVGIPRGDRDSEAGAG